jgi:ribosomal protein RSM22 (predicted rRNA methylase)
MELPRSIRQAVDAALEGVPLADLQRAAQRLSERYRSETRDGRQHLSDEMAALAYLAARMPATYAAIHASLDAVAVMRPGFAPATMLDVGAGPGTGVVAAHDLWPEVETTLIENAAAIRAVGERLLAAGGIGRSRWLIHNVAEFPVLDKTFDLVLISYVLDELAPSAIRQLMESAWATTADTLIVVEPGTPAGWLRILQVRAQLLAVGAQLVAPCPHTLACPLSPPDWCHFSRRVARSRMHRQVKSADVPWEDEKFIYLAASRKEGQHPQARIIAPPIVRGGTVSLKLCENNGSAALRLNSRRDGAAFGRARRASWGDVIWPDAIIPADSTASS